MKTIPRLRLKNLKTMYSIRLPEDPTYRQVVERMAKPAYDAILAELDAILHAHAGDIPAEEVYQLCTRLYAEAAHVPDVSPQGVVKTPLGIEAVKLGALFYTEVLFGVATALSQLLHQYAPIPGADERDLEEEMNALRRSDEGEQ